MRADASLTSASVHKSQQLVSPTGAALVKYFAKRDSTDVMQGQKNLHWAREAAKWGADFMARSTEEDRVLLHIGDIRADHNYIGRAEMYPQMDRNILFCKPGM